MSKNLFWTLYIAATLVLFALLSAGYRTPYGGDIVEYLGMSETLMNHASLELTPKDTRSMSRIINPLYLEDIQYYPKNSEGKRFPVHFPFYSLFLIPIRLILRLFWVDELRSFYITNWLIFTGITAYILNLLEGHVRKKIPILVLLVFSPILFFITWVGTEVLTMMLLLASAVLFFRKHQLAGIIVAILAYWQSQPLLPIPMLYIAVYLWSNIAWSGRKSNLFVRIKHEVIPYLLMFFILLVLPQLYSLVTFGVLSPWALFDGTKHEVSFSTISLLKTWELLFDPNLGLFWYAPVILMFGFIAMITSFRKNTKLLIFIPAFIVIGLLFQTNNNWNNGTAGYGPTRYALYLIPFLIYFLVQWLDLQKHSHKVILGLVVISQMYVFSFNGFLYPEPIHSLYHSPYAKYLLDTHPALYNPSPEIFIERTTHSEPDIVATTLYKQGDECKKAYVLKTATQDTLRECGAYPKSHLSNLSKNDLLRVANYPRLVKTPEATFWPISCAWEYIEPSSHFVCMKSATDFMRYTGVTDPTRFEKVAGHEGTWKIHYGVPIELTVPPGYYINHYSLDGFYVSF